MTIQKSMSKIAVKSVKKTPPQNPYQFHKNMKINIFSTSKHMPTLVDMENIMNRREIDYLRVIGTKNLEITLKSGKKQHIYNYKNYAKFIKA